MPAVFIDYKILTTYIFDILGSTLRFFLIPHKNTKNRDKRSTCVILYISPLSKQTICLCLLCSYSDS
jgi:hypothetical protein